MAGTEYIMTSVMTLYHYILHTRLTINDHSISGPGSRSRLQFVIPHNEEREHHRKEKMMMMRWLLLWSSHDEMISDDVTCDTRDLGPSQHLVTLYWPAPAPHDVEITGSQAAPPPSSDFFFSTINLGFGSALDCPSQEGKWIRLWLICGIYMSYEPG